MIAPRRPHEKESTALVDAVAARSVLGLELRTVAIRLRAVGLARTFREHQEHDWYPLAEQRDSRPLL